MVDMAIAANFVRELTENQFAEQKRGQRRNRAANGTGSGSDTANGSGSGSNTAPRADRSAGRTRIGRTFARLAQVRG
jgi:hypothetical protein